jgi:two-component system chemotaxis response regulator CheB
MIRVLIVEDSVTQREILKRALESDSQFAVAGEARNGREAVALVQEIDPDVVLMDIHMPDMDGIEATRIIMSTQPVPIVVLSATVRKRDVDLGLKAFDAGAVSVIEKPKGAALLHLHKLAPTLHKELLVASMARVKQPRVVRRPGEAARRLAAASAAAQAGLTPVKVIGICGSTGAPPVLSKIFSDIPRPFPLPVLLVQHISRGFEEGFAKWLSQSTGQTARIAVERQRLEPGIWVAPADRHLLLGAGGNRISLAERDPKDVHCPSGDPLFRSLATHFGPQAAGVLLTGMGDDGAHGLLALRASGGHTLIQNEASCVIWGMPKVAKQLDAAEHELEPAAISAALTTMAKQR